ncbi:hypothetical protein A1Q2_04964 [Trichosporon asahii var. asahii CBS 8904]|uniref:Replication termination factor 2 n=1 Tax=Trichosporon asahii var. asahii (strain CBS 8904) TaxID=1220162 RepID=K1VMY9_TRIAC|nr:hypothetical protein A1Q2_04964 [Trichosporon asahii var. asahii CBS 8904]
MGADGGSIPDRRDLVKTKGKLEKTDKALLRERFFYCALSKPVVLDPLGKLYNKEAIIEYLIDKTAYGDGDEICPYIKSVKTLNLMPNPALSEGDDATSVSRAPFVCWLSLKEMTGAVTFIAIRNCGCVFSEAAVRAIIPNLAKGPESSSDGPAEPVACPNCTKPFDPSAQSSVMPIYPSPEVQDLLLDVLLAKRAAGKSSKKRKADKGEKVAESENGEKKAKKDKAEKRDREERTGSGSPAPRAGAQPTVSRSVQSLLAEQEKKRLAAQENMSDAVKSMFRAKSDKKDDTSDFFGRTFNRVSTQIRHRVWAD